LHQYAVFKAEVLARYRRHTFSGHHDPGKVQRIGGGYCDDFGALRNVFHRAQRFHSHWQGKLLADEAADKASTTNLPAVLQPSKRNKQITPTRQHALTHQQLAEDYAVTLKKHAADRLNRASAVLTMRRVQQ